MHVKTRLLRAQMFLLRPIATQTGDFRTARAGCISRASARSTRL